MRPARTMRTIFTVLALALPPTASTAYPADGPVTVKLKRSSDNSYATLPLPSRILGIGVLKPDAVPNGQQLKPMSVPGDAPFDNLYTFSLDVGGFRIPLFLEYAPDTPGRPRPGNLYFGAAATAVSKWWELEQQKWDPNALKELGEKGLAADRNKRLSNYLETGQFLPYETKEQRKARENKEKEDAKKRKTGAAIPESPKPSLLVSAGRLSKGKHVMPGRQKPLPPGLATLGEHLYWSGALTTPSTTFEAILTDEWINSSSTKGASHNDVYRVAMVYPTGKTTGYAHFRSCTALTGEHDKMEITLFDDNLNGQFGETGKDSVMVGSALTLASETISIGNAVYRMAIDAGGRGLPSLILTPLEEKKTGKIRLIFEGPEGCEIQAALVSSRGSKDYFGLVNPSVDKMKSSSSRTKDEEKGPVAFEPVTVPAGEYQLSGGVVRRTVDGSAWPVFAFFDKGDNIVVKEGETVDLRLGNPLSYEIEFTSQDEMRVIELLPPLGAGKERYRWIYPHPPEPRFSLMGKAEAEGGPFVEPMSKRMEYVPDSSKMMTVEMKYDNVLFVPEAGPFQFTIEFNPLIFTPETVKMKRKTMDK